MEIPEEIFNNIFIMKANKVKKELVIKEIEFYLLIKKKYVIL